MPPTPLPRSFYNRDVILVARELLGKRLVRRTREGVASGRIVEVEAYLADGDSASHAFRGMTRRNAAMFGPPGHAYVYSIHARFCLNVVTDLAEVPSAVLIRAVQPLAGIAFMQRRRGKEQLRDLTRGPARLCEAFEVDRKLDRWDLTQGKSLWIANSSDGELQENEISTTTRIGVTSAQDLPLRFIVAGNPFVSGPRKRD